MDFDKLVIELRAPIEIYLAAVGNPKPLADRILGGEHLYEYERKTLAAYLLGELVPPKRRKGQKRISYLQTMDDVEEHILKNAVVLYHWLMREIEKKHGSKHKTKFEVIEYVAKKDCIDIETLLNRINRPKKNGTTDKANDVSREVISFHIWLHETGQIPNYPPSDRIVGWEAENLKWRRRLGVQSRHLVDRIEDESIRL